VNGHTGATGGAYRPPGADSACIEPKPITASAAIAMSEDHTIEEYLHELRGRIQVKLARAGAPADPGTLRLVCLAMALRVADPAGLRLLMKPLSPRLYPVLETLLAQVDGDFGDEIAELQDLIADAQEDPAWLAEVQQAMQAGAISMEKRPQEHIAHLILELFVDLSGE
jgi:hypothetical protein